MGSDEAGLTFVHVRSRVVVFFSLPGTVFQNSPPPLLSRGHPDGTWHHQAMRRIFNTIIITHL